MPIPAYMWLKDDGGAGASVGQGYFTDAHCGEQRQ